MTKEWLSTIRDALLYVNTTNPGISLASDLRRVCDEMDVAEQHLLPDWQRMEKPIMTVDFDGVISEYRNGWEGIDKPINESPVPGVFEWLGEAVKEYTVLIFSARCNAKSGIKEMKKWMLDKGLDELTLASFYFQPGKPSAAVMIDDRAIRFMGDWKAMPSPNSLKRHLRPWYYNISKWRHHRTESLTCPHNVPWDDCPDCRH